MALTRYQRQQVAAGGEHLISYAKKRCAWLRRRMEQLGLRVMSTTAYSDDGFQVFCKIVNGFETIRITGGVTEELGVGHVMLGFRMFGKQVKEARISDSTIYDIDLHMIVQGVKIVWNENFTAYTKTITTFLNAQQNGMGPVTATQLGGPTQAAYANLSIDTIDSSFVWPRAKVGTDDNLLNGTTPGYTPCVTGIDTWNFNSRTVDFSTYIFVTGEVTEAAPSISAPLPLVPNYINTVLELDALTFAAPNLSTSAKYLQYVGDMNVAGRMPEYTEVTELEIDRTYSFARIAALGGLVQNPAGLSNPAGGSVYAPLPHNIAISNFPDYHVSRLLNNGVSPSTEVQQTNTILHAAVVGEQFLRIPDKVYSNVALEWDLNIHEAVNAWGEAAIAAHAGDFWFPVTYDNRTA